MRGNCINTGILRQTEFGEPRDLQKMMLEFQAGSGNERRGGDYKKLTESRQVLRISKDKDVQHNHEEPNNLGNNVEKLVLKDVEHV